MQLFFSFTQSMQVKLPSKECSSAFPWFLPRVLKFTDVKRKTKNYKKAHEPSSINKKGGEEWKHFLYFEPAVV